VPKEAAKSMMALKSTVAAARRAAISGSASGADLSKSRMPSRWKALRPCSCW
jgi:hypothetical protein